MAELTGSEIIARCLQKEGIKDLFYIMGGPMLLAEATCIKEGIRMIDVRHEQAAAFMCQAYSRLKQVPSVCMAASGPGVTNLITGMANALIDCCPVVALGGSSPLSQFGRQVFQEIDQVELMRGCCKYVDRLINLKRIPQQINFALQKAIIGKPGPVYLDCPGDMLYQKIDENLVDWSFAGRPILDSRPMGDPRQVDALVGALAEAKNPLIVSGSGVIWSRAWAEMQAFVEAAGVPFYTTPQGRGVVPDDHPYSFLSMRSGAFKEADLIIVLGTRMNYIIGHAVAAALRARRKNRPYRYRSGRDRHRRALRRYPHRRRLQGGARSIAARHQGPHQPRQIRRLAQATGRWRGRQTVRPPAPTSCKRTATSIPSACWKRCATSPSAMPFCVSMGRRR